MAIRSYAKRESTPAAASAKDQTPRSPSDPYGGLAVMAENKMPILPATQWDLQQRRQWPPPPYQAYCTRHFVQECLVYYSLERKGFAAEEGHRKKSMAIHRNVKETQAELVRVQPSRKAKGGTRTATQGEPGQNFRGGNAEYDNTDLKETPQERKTRLQLHLTWSTFRAHLETIIGVEPQGEEFQGRNNTNGEASGSNDDDGKPYLRHAPCPFQGRIPPGCRYCHHKLPAAPLDGKLPERRAPMAPMHPVGPEYIEGQPIHAFGGLRFAVDACADEKVIVLVGLETWEGEAGLGRRMAAARRNKDRPSKRTRGAK